MKLILITAAAITLGACATEPPTCGGPNEVAQILLTKEGFPIIDDQAPIPFPCPIVPVTTTPDAPYTPHEPPVTPPAPEKVKHPNSGRGNGSELDGNGQDVDPGNSGGHNNGGD